jgi:hypothetical protein
MDRHLLLLHKRLLSFSLLLAALFCWFAWTRTVAFLADGTVVAVVGGCLL